MASSLNFVASLFIYLLIHSFMQNFLSSNGFVHRDLAARNVLLGEDKVAKISDFGLMRQSHENVYHLKKGKKIPVKWMAPEALYNSEYTTKSDV